MTRCCASPRAPVIAETDRRRLTPEYRFKSPSEMRKLFADLPEALRQHAGDRAALRLHAEAGEADPAARSRTPAAEGEPAALKRTGRRRAGAAAGAARSIRSPSSAQSAEDGKPIDREATAKPYRERLAFEIGVITQHGLRRLLPDRRRLHPMGQGARHSRRAGPRLGRGLAGRLGD